MFTGTYKVPQDIPSIEPHQRSVDLVPHERCRNCQVTTREVQNVITDEPWITDMNNLKNNYKKTQVDIDNKIKQLSFLIPLYNTENRLFRMIDNSTQNNTDTTRQKRSLLYPTTDNYQLNKIEMKLSIHELESDNNTIHTYQFKPSHHHNKSTWFNIFDRVKNTFNNWITFNKTLPENDEATNIQIASTDVNSSIFLLDFLIRKVTGQKYLGSLEETKSLNEVQATALNIVDDFEDILNRTSAQWEIDIQDVDFHEVYMQIGDYLRNGKYVHLSNVLYNTALDAFNQNSELSHDLKEDIERMLDETLLDENKYKDTMYNVEEKNSFTSFMPNII